MDGMDQNNPGVMGVMQILADSGIGEPKEEAQGLYGGKSFDQRADEILKEKQRQFEEMEKIKYALPHLQDKRIVRSLDDLEKVIKIMKENGVENIHIDNGLNIGMQRAVTLYPLDGAQSGADPSQLEKRPPPPTNDELLLNPYAGMENS